MSTNDTTTALGDLRILDLGGLTTAYASRLMADFGADVILVEPPSGDRTRHVPPYSNKHAEPDNSLTFLAFQSNKRSLVLDIRDENDRAKLKSIVKNIDIVFEGYDPGYLNSIGLDYTSLKELNPSLVLASITPYGQTGPFSSFKGGDLHSEAMGGLMTVSYTHLTLPTTPYV